MKRSPHSSAPLLHQVLHITLSTQDIHQLATWLPEDPRSTEFRDSLIIGTMALCGLRRAETTWLQRDEFKIVSGQPWLYFFLGKGPKRRSVPLPNFLYRRFILFWSAYEQSSSSGPAIFRVRGQRAALSTSSIHEIVKKRTTEILGAPVRCHMLRHSAASSWLRNGADIKTVQVLLGHSSIATTERYVHTTVDQLVKAIADSSPDPIRQLSFFDPAISRIGG